MVSGKNNLFLITCVSLVAITGAAFIQSQSVGTDMLLPQATVLIILTSLLFLSLFVYPRLWLENITIPISQDQKLYHPIPQDNTGPINLFNYTGISDGESSLQSISKNDNEPEQQHNNVPKLIISHFSPLPHPALISMALRAEQNLSFSPGFIFVRLARGPPDLT